jgi:hypothetical protein
MLTMTNYLIFKNDPASGKLNAPGSPEQVACDIARAVALDADPPNAYIVYPAESPQATFEALKATPRFSIELHQGKIDHWLNEAEPLLEKIYSVHDALGNAYGIIMDAIRDLESDLENSEHFHDLQLTSDMDIDRAFEYIENPSEYEFVDKLEEIFEVKAIQK